MSRPHVRTVFKWLGISVAFVLLVLVVVAAGLWWWSGTAASLEWSLKQAARSQPLLAEGVTGSLRSGLKAKRLQWSKDGLTIEATGADLAWQPLALARATLKLDYLRAENLRMEDRRPPQPRVIPVSLVLPLRVEIDDVQVGQLQWLAGDNRFEASALAGRYSFNAVHHKIELTGVRWAGGRYSGEATLGAHGPLPVEVQLRGEFESPVPGSDRKLPLVFQAKVQGPITEMQANAVLEGAAGTANAGTQATATARLTPWAPQPVPQARADFRQLDLAALWSQAPQTRLAGQLQVQPAGADNWSLTADVTNALAGPWDARRLPVERVVASGEWRTTGQALVRELQARVGDGQIKAHGEWIGVDGWTVNAQLAGVDPAALHTRMAAVPLSGQAGLKGRGQAIDFDLDVKGEGRPRRTSSDVQRLALAVRQVLAQGRWNDGMLSLPKLDVRTDDARLRGTVEARPAARSGSAEVQLEAPGLQASAKGRLSERSGGGTLQATSGDLRQALQWVATLPGMPTLDANSVGEGRAELQLAWQGGWGDPAVQARANVPRLVWRGASPAASSSGGVAPWVMRDAVVSLNGRLSNASLQARALGEQGQRRFSLQLSGQGGRRSAMPEAWQGQLTVLQMAASDPAIGAGSWTLTLQKTFDLRWAGGSFDAGAGKATLTAPRAPDTNPQPPALLAWDPVHWRNGELRTAGRLTGLPMAWLELIGGPQLAGSAISGDMVFDAQWDAALGASPRIRASLARSRGDVSILAESADGTLARVRAGVREARLTITGQGESLTAELRWDSERGGSAQGRLSTRLVPGGALGWQWPGNSPLDGRLQAQLPRIGVWSLLAPPGWRLRGSLGANVAVSGTRDVPQLGGTLAADDLALRSVVDGIELQGGRMRARLDGQRVLIDEFVLHGPGSGTSGGTLVATGEGVWTAAGPQARMSAQIDKLRASNRDDRQLTVSGRVNARRDASGTVVDGKLAVDQARITLPEQSTPKLGDDVVVRNAAAPVTRTEARVTEQAAKRPSQRVSLQVEIDLGDNFRVQGLGIDTRLRGSLALSGQSVTAPRLVGTIRAGGGEYRAYGQRLNIERGIIRFTGPPENPALDILAIRPNLVQRVGVQVTGSALTPYVRLYAEPDLPDVEKLSWLVTGRASAGTGAEAALVQQAALALLAGRSGAGKRGFAASLGLDELSFRRDGTDGPSITLGKRFGRNFYAAYERSLAGALGTLYIFFDLTQRFTLRAQTGERTAVDVIYTLSFR